MASTYHLADKALDGQLAQRLEEMRANGATYDQLATYFDGLGISVSRETIRKWVAIAAGTATAGTAA